MRRRIWPSGRNVVLMDRQEGIGRLPVAGPHAAPHALRDLDRRAPTYHRINHDLPWLSPEPKQVLDHLIRHLAEMGRVAPIGAKLPDVERLDMAPRLFFGGSGRLVEIPILSDSRQ